MRHREDEDLSTAEKVEQLQKALEAGRSVKSYQDPVLQVEALDELSRRYLTAGARIDLERRSKFLHVADSDGKSYQAIYLSAVVKTGNEEAGVAEIAKILNDLSSQGLVHSYLAPLSSIRLAITTSVLKSVVFAFPLVPENCVEDCRVKYGKFFTLEGGVGPEIEDLSVPLAEGEFLGDIVISHTFMLHDSNSSLQDRIQRQIDEYLRVLPDGTEIVQKTELSIYDLAYRMEVKFRHPQMHDVSKVELDYVRCVRRLPEGGIEQYNRFIGVKYFDKFGKEMYQR